MNKRNLTKAIVSNLTGYSVGAAASTFLATNRRHSDNRLVETTIDAATVVTGFAVAGVVHEPVRTYTDAKIDAAFDWFEQNFQK